MNRTYSIVWSAVRNMYIVASELARGHSKVKIQAHANEVSPFIKKPESGWTISAKHNALTFAIVAALGLASPLAMADNSVSYIDGVDHDLNAETSPMFYSGADEGAALYLEGLPTQGQGWQPTSATGTNIEIGTDGGGAPLSSGGDAVATAISLYRGATLELTEAKIYTKGRYTQGINLDEQSNLTLNGGSLEVEGNYGILTLYKNSQATLIGTEVTATADTSSDISLQQGSTLNIKDGSKITLTRGQLSVVGDTNGNAFLNVSDSTVSSTGADSTVVAANRGILNIKNSSVTHNNATGAAIEASSASTLNVSGDDKSQMIVNSKGVGVKGIASSVEIDGATITADDDGILITSQGKSGWYDDTNALTVNNANVASQTAALHVDSKTNINDPIELTNSTLTGPTAIKLESAVTVQANSTTLDGNVDAGITASSLSLTNSSLQGSVNGVYSSLTLDADSQWTMSGSSALGSLTSNGEITLGDGSASAKTLQITNALTLQNDSQLNITLSATDSPAITTGSAILDGSLTLNLDSTAAFGDPTSDQQFKSITLIDSDNAISTNVDSLTTNIDTDSLPDYLTFGVDVDANDNTNFVLEQQLSWNANATSISEASGTFTLGDNETFEVTSELSKVSPVPGGWDGETLTKEGDGTLILSNTANDYGNTNINGGTLSANDAAALGSGDVAIAENATLELGQGTLDNNVTGGGQIIKSGSGDLIVTGDNTYSGGTTITGGMLTADHADSLGTGAIANNGVLQVGEGELENTLSGSGSLVKTGMGKLTLSGDNTYSGGTTIADGVLIVANVNALGGGDVDNAGTLKLDAEGEFNLANVTTQSGATTELAKGTTLNVDSLTQQADSTLNIDLSKANESAITADSVTLAGTLNVTGIGSVTDSWTPEAYTYTLIDSDSAITSDFDNLTVAGMSREDVDFLTIDGKVDEADNTHYDLTASLSWYADRDNASTDAHGTFTLSDPDGSFNVAANLTDVDDTLDPNSTWDGKSLTKLGAGKLTLSGANTYSGDTNVQEGTLWLSGDGSIGEMGSQQAVNVSSGATFGGSNGTTVNGKVTNEGTLVFGDSEETGAIFTLNGDLINMGAMTSGSSSSTPGNTLYVDGDYTGNGGSLYLNTVLGDDDSATDKLVITGDASGTTDLYINGIGDGAQTTNGIEVVDVGGVSTSDAFVLKNEVNASLYTYRLYWNESDNDWYLASKAQSDDDDSGGDGTPSDDGDDGGNVTPSDDGGDVAPQYRADIGAYMGNQWMARNLQMQTLYDREGSQYRNADGSVWARFKAGKAESEAVSSNIDMDSNYSQFQLGGDILAWGNGQQSVTVGVMASYINADTDSTGNRGADGSQFTSSGNVDGYNLGVYATWFADAQTHSGVYVDSWYQYGFYNNSVESGDAGSESYDSTANAVSLETGYRYDIALNNGNTVSLTPQAQVVWQNYSADSVKDNYGTRIDGQDGDSWTTRLGLRVDGKLYKGSRTVIQPFAEANWLHTSDDVSVSFDDATVKQDLPANRAELKVGLQADIDKQWSVRAQVAGQTGSNDFGDLNGSLNLRYNW
ncbi:autotransporter outer membrane beta-barrel domain-containing protein [Salmonella enterica]|uniref:autotransporter outer membrane beta-barrel domain-containing protein n=1 Tax=Salmonella enterica TaxID=28901 RepID=UPI002933D755|nr:autotransporter outer membrane beta-barrel domain-containing protein [Salmonella enterica]MDV2048290.1 autotransporter outer membrane beta-barrel domain-containing protein [Salmonella enterica subsp. enterica serovar Shamba]MDV2066547.1 autotransporter outer membrane beta-barrel domain-containing protein [Salmonella enterica subsp. enterica serovar Shamba]MDV2074478.1 autotransporter outer membrane beta-barrel domain-containing protein [Salmonella enterica subsp. enterica serovar Shamba]